MEEPMYLWILIHVCVFVCKEGRCETYVQLDILVNTTILTCHGVTVPNCMLPYPYCVVED